MEKNLFLPSVNRNFTGSMGLTSRLYAVRIAEICVSRAVAVIRDLSVYSMRLFAQDAARLSRYRLNLSMTVLFSVTTVTDE